MKQYSRVCERVDLDAIFYNFPDDESKYQRWGTDDCSYQNRWIRTWCSPDCPVTGPVDYIWGYAVATLDEAVVLRKNEIKKPILVLGCIFPDQWKQ